MEPTRMISNFHTSTKHLQLGQTVRGEDEIPYHIELLLVSVEPYQSDVDLRQAHHLGRQQFQISRVDVCHLLEKLELTYLQDLAQNPWTSQEHLLDLKS